MIKPLLVTTLFLAAVGFLVPDHTDGSRRSGSAGPMGTGSVEDRNALTEWNLERLRDPATGLIPVDIHVLERAFARTLPRRDADRSLNWTQQGPINRGGRTRAFRVDRTNSDVLIAGGVTGGIWRSTSGGDVWERTNNPTDIQNISCIEQDPRTGHEGTWYCGTGENYGVVSGTSFTSLLPGDGIFKSTDGGLSWSLLQSTVGGDPQVFETKGAFKHVNSIAVDPVRMDSDIVVAAIFDGLVRSNDGGLTWSTVLGIDTTITTTSLYTEVQVTSQGVYYAAIGRTAPYKGVYRSTDGLTWTNIGVGNYPVNAERTVIAIDPNDEHRVWFFCESPGAGVHGHSLLRYTYVSGDGAGAGGAWSNRSANLPNGSCVGFFDFDFGYISTQTSYDMCIAVHPTDSNTVFIGGTSVYRSTDAWSTPGTYKWVGGYQCDTLDPKNYVWPDHHPDQHWLEFPNGDGGKLYSINDGGVHITLDPMADSIDWQERNTGYYTSQFYTVAIEGGAATSPYVLGGMQDNGTYMAITEDPSTGWARVLGGDGAYCALPEGRPFMIASTQLGKLYKAEVDDFGVVGDFERIDPVVQGVNYNFINQFVLDPLTNDQLYWCAGNKIHRNVGLAAIPYNNEYYEADTTNWRVLSVTTGARPVSLDISLAQPDALWYGSVNGHVYRVDSLNSTPVRTEIDWPEWTVGAYVSCVAPNDYDASEWMITFCNYGVRSVWHTADSGATWASISGNIEEFPDGTGSGPAVFWGLIYPTWGGENNRYFIGTSTGLYSTAVLDGDNTVWEQEGADLIGNVPINMITARGSDGLIAVGTHGSGVFTANMPAAPIGISEAAVPLATGQAWPNPATEIVNVDLFLSQAARLDVEVFDLGGRSVLRKSLGERSAGNSRFSWDLRNTMGARVPQGTYLVRLAAGRASQVVRVVVR